MTTIVESSKASPPAGGDGGVSVLTTGGYKLGPLYFTLPVANIALFMLWLGVGAFILPTQVMQITGGADPDALKTASTAGAVLATIGNPLFGLISDRTRSKFGRRSPWILICGAVGALLIIAQAGVESIAMLGISWGAIQFVMNGYQAALTAVMPDRVPAKFYGRFSALLGLATPLATVIGSFVLTGINLKYFGLGDKTIGGFDGKFFSPIPGHIVYKPGYYLIAGVVIVAAVLFVIISPDRSSKDLPKEEFSLKGFLTGFKVSPKEHPDFFLALFSRMGVMLGYFLVFTYNLYILMEYVKIDPKKLGGTMGALMVLSAVFTILAAAVIGPIVDRVGKVKPFVLGSGILAAISLMIPLIWPTENGMAWYNVVHGIAFGVYMAVDMALITQVLPNPKDVGKDMGLINIANAGPQILAPTIAAWIVVDFNGGYEALFPVGAAVSLIGALLVVKIKGVK